MGGITSNLQRRIIRRLRQRDDRFQTTEETAVFYIELETTTDSEPTIPAINPDEPTIPAINSEQIVFSVERVSPILSSSIFNHPCSTISNRSDDVEDSTQVVRCFPIPLVTNEERIEIAKQKLNTLELDGLDFIDELKVLIRQAPENFMTKETVLDMYKEKLTQYELIEIDQYKQIYAFGFSAKKGYNVPRMEINAWYDDANHFYKWIRFDHLGYRYETLSSLGKGGFAEVVKAYDHKVNEYVAIKLVKNHPRAILQAEREVRILQFLQSIDLNDGKNIIRVKNAFGFRSHFCIVFELLSCSLYDLMVKNNCKGFGIVITQNFIRNLLHSLKFLSRCKIIHGDIKPENIMKCPRSAVVKLADFGLSNFVRPKKELTNKIQTLWYRAPEVLLGHSYGEEIDMWSIGCLIPELLTGEALFAGEYDRDQMALIIEMLGMPPSNIIQKSPYKYKYFSPNEIPWYFNVTDTKDDPLVAGRSPNGKPRGYPGTRKLEALIGDDSELNDLIKRCLTWDPTQRISPKEALRHPWLKNKIPVPPAKIHTTVPSGLCQHQNRAQQMYEADFRSPPTFKADIRKTKIALPISSKSIHKVERLQTSETAEDKHFLHDSVRLTY